MPNEVLVKTGTAAVWSDATDYSSTATGLARTAQIDLTSIAAGAARQGAKADLGATRAKQYLVFVGIEFAVAPASFAQVRIYWAGSPSSTAANANPGGASGSDAAYTGTAGDSIADSLLQLQYIGSLIATADATAVVQYQYVGTLVDPDRYGMPVVFNNTAQAFHSDAVEMLVALIPIIDEIQ